MQKPAAGSSRRRVLIGAAFLAVLLTAAGAWFFLIRSPEESVPHLLTYREGVLLYTFHVPSGSQELFDVRADPSRLENLAGERPEDTARLRRLLTEKLGVKDLEELRKGPLIEALRAHGYLH